MKLAGKNIGSTMYVVQAKDRSNKTTDVVEDQKHKLFLVSHAEQSFSGEEWLFSHGKSAFLKAEAWIKLKCHVSKSIVFSAVQVA